MSANADNLLYLLQVSNSAFPTGAFAHSLGFEELIADGKIGDADSLATTAGLWLRHSLAPVDGIAVARACEAADRDDIVALIEIDALLAALKVPRESAHASLATGAAFLRAASAAFGGRRLDAYIRAIADAECMGHGATAFGVAAADAGVPIETAVLAFLQSAFANVVNVAARLVPLGQLDVQRVLADAREPLKSCARRACGMSLDDAASTTAFLDLASMRHERLYTRLCIS